MNQAVATITEPSHEHILKTARRGADFYQEPCPQHGYFGQGWPSHVLGGVGGLLKSDCKTCYRIWREVHINPGTEHAGK